MLGFLIMLCVFGKGSFEMVRIKIQWQQLTFIEQISIRYFVKLSDLILRKSKMGAAITHEEIKTRVNGLRTTTIKWPDWSGLKSLERK